MRRPWRLSMHRSDTSSCAESKSSHRVQRRLSCLAKHVPKENGSPIHVLLFNWTLLLDRLVSYAARERRGEQRRGLSSAEEAALKAELEDVARILGYRYVSHSEVSGVGRDHEQFEEEYEQEYTDERRPQGERRTTRRDERDLLDDDAEHDEELGQHEHERGRRGSDGEESEPQGLHRAAEPEPEPEPEPDAGGHARQEERVPRAPPTLSRSRSRVSDLAYAASV